MRSDDLSRSPLKPNYLRGNRLGNKPRRLVLLESPVALAPFAFGRGGGKGRDLVPSIPSD